MCVRTNVPGPPAPLYLAGAPLLELFPVVSLVANFTLIVAVLSYAGQLNITAVADRNAAGDFPVQNGKADFTLSVTAVFQPSCSPPMTVAFTDVTVTDTTNGLTQSFPGTF